MNALGCNAHPFVSVIVCTVGDRPMLWDCLHSLLAQECHRFETIVVLNGPPNENLARTVADYSLKLISEPRRGVCVARNRAIQHACGEVLAFADDDVIARPDWIHELLKGFEDPSVGCVTGLVVPEGPVPNPEERANRYYASERAQSTWTLGNSEVHWVQKTLGESTGFGCNMAFRKSFLLERTLFPEDLGAGSVIGGGDEFYMFVQVLKHGFRIYHNPSAVVTHVFEPGGGPQKKRMAQVYTSSVALATKLVVEEKCLRWETVGWLLVGFRRRLRRLIHRRSVSSEPQELLTSLEKIRAYLRGPRAYWESRRVARQTKR